MLMFSPMVKNRFVWLLFCSATVPKHCAGETLCAAIRATTASVRLRLGRELVIVACLYRMSQYEEKKNNKLVVSLTEIQISKKKKKSKTESEQQGIGTTRHSLIVRTDLLLSTNNCLSEHTLTWNMVVWVLMANRTKQMTGIRSFGTERETSEVRNYGSYAREARKRHGVTRVRVLSKVLFRLDRLVLSRIRNSQNNCSGQGEASHPEYRTSCFRLEDRRKRLRTCEHTLNSALFFLWTFSRSSRINQSSTNENANERRREDSSCKLTRGKTEKSKLTGIFLEILFCTVCVKIVVFLVSIMPFRIVAKECSWQPFSVLVLFLPEIRRRYWPNRVWKMNAFIGDDACLARWLRTNSSQGRGAKFRMVCTRYGTLVRNVTVFQCRMYADVTLRISTMKDAKAIG